jgi:CPA2 family monovalent cation:H+ antiporter-2
MPHSTTLMTTIIAALVLAFVLGSLAHRLRISPLVGYLLAGVVVGPFTPGFVADQGLASELAEIGVILLMFGVGLHFSVKDLLSVKAVAVPGALLQMALGMLLGMGFARLMGWSLGTGLVFGLSLSVASTVVTLRELQARRLVETDRGRLAVGWLVVEDFAMVLALVALPAAAGLMGLGVDHAAGEQPAAGLDLQSILETLALTLGKLVAFVAVMLIVGRRVIPWLLQHTARTGSRELFRLGVLAIALGVAFGSAELFGVSFALGAFFAGMVLSESPLSHEAAQETLPLRDAFAVLFFVSVGMLFNPAILVSEPRPLLATVLIIVIANPVIGYLITRALRQAQPTALLVGVCRAQIGEFSFILAGLGVEFHLLSETAEDLILAGAIISILVNPFVFLLFERVDSWLGRADRRVQAVPDKNPPAQPASAPLTGHAVVVGFGRVGSLVVEALLAKGRPVLVIEGRPDLVAGLRARGIAAIAGNAAAPAVARLANMARARWLAVAIPDAFEAGEIVEGARAANPTLEILARAHSNAAVEYLNSRGADVVVMGEREIARAMIGHLVNAPAPEGSGAGEPPAYFPPEP